MPVTRRSRRQVSRVRFTDLIPHIDPVSLFGDLTGRRRSLNENLRIDLYKNLYGKNFDPANPSVPLDGPDRPNKVTRYFPNKKRRKTDAPESQPEPDQKETDGSESDTPPEIDMTKGITSHSAEHCCVDLGSFPIPSKDYSNVDASELGPKNFFIQYHQEVHASAANKVLFTTIAEPNYSNFGGTSTNPIQQYTTTSGATAMHGAGFNTTKKKVDAWNHLGLTYPTYDYANATGVTNPNDANRAIIIQNQYVEFKIKNFGDVDNSDSPLFLTIYGYEIVDDIYSNHTGATSNDNFQIDYHIQNGWSSYYSGSTSTTNLENSQLQPYGANVSENMFLNSYCKCIGVLKNCLAMGQEGTARFLLKKPQYHTFSQFAKAQPLNSTGYRNITLRKGEIFFLIKAHGGAQAVTTASPPATTIRVGKINFGVFTLSRWEYRAVLRSTSNPKFSLSVADTTATVDADADIGDYFN